MMDRKEVTDYLRRVPDLIEEAVKGLSDEELRRRPSPDGWSALEVCCHLRDSAEEEGIRVRRLVEEEGPTFDPYNEQVRARERNYQGDDPGRVRAALRAFWGGLAYQLEALADEQWERAGRHPESGPVTVRSRAEDEVTHAQAHLEQIRATRTQT
jgi:hypothetical protein